MRTRGSRWLAGLGCPVAPAAAAGPVAAQTAPTLRITPFAGGGLYLGEVPQSVLLVGESGEGLRIRDGERDDGFAAGLHAGVRFNARWALEGTLAYAPTAVSGTGWADDTDVDSYTYGASLLFYPVGRHGRVEPFLAAGAGAKTYDHADIDAETDFMWNTGVGLDVALTPALALRLEARDYISVFDPETYGADEELQHDLLLTAGLSFTLPLPLGGRR